MIVQLDITPAISCYFELVKLRPLGSSDQQRFTCRRQLRPLLKQSWSYLHNLDHTIIALTTTQQEST